ncbi:MAG: hydantoinase/oxoprolinase family protein, partial [Hyphomicrobiaceae bacterium]
MSAATYIIGVDVGGTFTDVFFLDRTTGKVQTAKVPSSHGDQSKGFIDGISQQVSEFADIATVVHGTTVGTNALLERKGARTGIITTQGFRDVLEMRRRDR